MANRVFGRSAPIVLLTVTIVWTLSSSFVAGNVGPNRVNYLPGLASNSSLDEMYTGYLDTDDGYGSQLFYWLAKAREAKLDDNTGADNTPVILWLQGGPGCAGGLGWFYENGPYTMASDASLTFNPYSWNRNAHLFFIDQPIGSGLSTLSENGTNATYATTIEESTAQLYRALKYFFSAHFPQLAKNPLFITGESYAGKYIPNIATAILDGQSSYPLNLVSIAIGDGWVSPLEQTSVYGQQAWNLGLIDSNELEEVNREMTKCTQLVDSKDWHNAQVVCDGLLNNIVAAAGNICVDDVRSFGDDLIDNRLERYFNQFQVAEALFLHRPPQDYQPCSALAGAALSEDEMKPSVHLLPRLIKDLQMVYIYEGIFDLNCGVPGVEKYLTTLYPSEMKSSKKFIWYDPELKTVSGYVKNLLPTLTYIEVFGAGHMVPFYKPRAAIDMLDHLLTNTRFAPQPAPSKSALSRIDSLVNLTVSLRTLRVPHFHHLYDTVLPASVFGASDSWINHPAVVKAQSQTRPRLSFSSSSSPSAGDIDILTPLSGSTFSPAGFLNTSWKGGNSDWSLTLGIFDVNAGQLVVATVSEDVPCSAGEWAIGLSESLVCGRPYAIEITDPLGHTYQSAQWSITCRPLAFLEPAQPGQLFPQGGPVTLQWYGGSPDWELEIDMVNTATGAVIQTFEKNYSNANQYYTATLMEPLDCVDSFYFLVTESANRSKANSVLIQLGCPTSATVTVTPTPTPSDRTLPITRPSHRHHRTPVKSNSIAQE